MTEHIFVTCKGGLFSGDIMASIKLNEITVR